MKLRRAQVILGKYEGQTGYFHGFFQIKDENYSYPHAVMEFSDGNTAVIEADYIQFLDEAGKDQQ